MTFLRPTATTLLLTLLFIAGCGGGGEEKVERPDAPPNVLLIYIDTIRADHMSLYGYERPTTPRLEEFAATATTFDQAITPSTWTRASFASYFTGMEPSVHGCEGRDGVVDPALTTLAERFKAKGYTTAAIYANDNIAPGLGFAQGFDLYEKPKPRSGYLKDGDKVTGAREMNERIMEWLHDERPEEPWLLFLLYIDPHDPYLPHREHSYGEKMTRAPRGSRYFLEKWKHATEKKSQQQVERDIRHLYDSEIGFVDRHVGAVLDTMNALGLMDETMIVVSSDHGEGLWDHEDYRGHGHHVYQEQVRVPLIVRWPGVTPPGLRVTEPVATMDVFGMLAAAYGTADPDEHQAQDLYPWFVGEGEARPVFTDERIDTVDMRAVTDGRWKLIDDLGRERVELYDLAADPGELASLTEAEPGTVARLQDLLTANLAANDSLHGTLVFEGAEPVLTDEEKAGLKALGY